MAKKGIRPYGPGKYGKIIDGYAHDVALDGGLDEEESYPDGGGWYGLLLLDKQARDAIHQAAHYAEDDLYESRRGSARRQRGRHVLRAKVHFMKNISIQFYS